jgi:hypothetical protein
MICENCGEYLNALSHERNIEQVYTCPRCHRIVKYTSPASSPIVLKRGDILPKIDRPTLHANVGDRSSVERVQHASGKSTGTSDGGKRVASRPVSTPSNKGQRLRK